MKYFYDCEFLEDGKTIMPISIGIVAEDSREYYAVFQDIGNGALYDCIRQHRWLMQNVVPHLPLMKRKDHLPNLVLPESARSGRFDLDEDSLKVLPRNVIVKQVKNFFLGDNEHIELWGYYSAYDHVLLSQLFGRMIDLPKGMPMWTNDIQQVAYARGLEDSLPAQVGNAHNALDDARWTRAAWQYLQEEAVL